MSNPVRPQINFRQARKPAARLKIAPKARASHAPSHAGDSAVNPARSAPVQAPRDAPASAKTASAQREAPQARSEGSNADAGVVADSQTSANTDQEASSSTAATHVPAPSPSLSVSPMPTRGIAAASPSPQIDAGSVPASAATSAESPSLTAERLTTLNSARKSPALLFRRQDMRPSPIIMPHACPSTMPPLHYSTSEQSVESGPLLKRIAHKLDIKPHQSPRRAALRVQSHALSPDDSPLMLSSPLESRQMPTVALEVTSSGASSQAAKKKTAPRARTELASSRRKRRRKGGDRDEVRTDSASDDEINSMPARERAMVYAQKMLLEQENPKTSTAIVAKRTASNATRKTEDENASVSLPSWYITKRESTGRPGPAEMTMGELAMTVPHGRRHRRDEEEELPPEFFGGDFAQDHEPSESAPRGGGRSVLAPKVEMIDGRIVIRTVQVDAQPSVDDDADMDFSATLTRKSRSQRITPGRRWSRDETKHFYCVLTQVGPNFSMMATLFPTRTRRELKTKFKNEEKTHAQLIETALAAAAAPMDDAIAEVITKMVDKQVGRKRRKKQPLDDATDDVLDDDELASRDADDAGAASPHSTSSPRLRSVSFADMDEEPDDRQRMDSFDFAS